LVVVPLSELRCVLLYIIFGCLSIIYLLTRPLVQAIDVFNGTSGTSAAFLTAVSMAFGTGIAVLAYTIAPVSGE
jgi:hypothetical protein